MTRLSERILDLVERVMGAVERQRQRRRRAVLQSLGMRLGSNVQIPASTWIDRDFCYLISIGDNCAFGEQCLILAHDAQMDEFLDAGRLGRVVVGADCQIGARTTILPGVEIGPRTLVAPHSVVLKSLPPDSYCAGNPARVVSTLNEMVTRHREEMQHLPRYTPAEIHRLCATEDGRAALLSALQQGGYMTEDGSVLE